MTVFGNIIAHKLYETLVYIKRHVRPEIIIVISRTYIYFIRHIIYLCGVICSFDGVYTYIDVYMYINLTNK